MEQPAAKERGDGRAKPVATAASHDRPAAHARRHRRPLSDERRDRSAPSVPAACGRAASVRAGASASIGPTPRRGSAARPSSAAPAQSRGLRSDPAILAFPGQLEVMLVRAGDPAGDTPSVGFATLASATDAGTAAPGRCWPMAEPANVPALHPGQVEPFTRDCVLAAGNRIGSRTAWPLVQQNRAWCARLAPELFATGPGPTLDEMLWWVGR